MSNQFYSFDYDPVQQGYNTSTWRTVYGDADVVGGQLVITKGAILHYGDIVRGDVVFSLNMPAPVFDDNVTIGLTQYNKGAYLYFKVDDGVLTAEVSDGVTSTSSAAIAWDTAWTSTDTEFRIKWEAGMASFFIDGKLKAVFNDTYALGVPTTIIPGCPMSLYMANDSVSSVLLDYITVKGIQGFVMSEGNADSSFELIARESDRVVISENTTLLIPVLFANNGIIFDGISVSEGITMFTDILYAPGVVQNINISESVTVARI